MSWCTCKSQSYVIITPYFCLDTSPQPHSPVRLLTTTAKEFVDEDVTAERKSSNIYNITCSNDVIPHR